jgi:Cu(I)/Ag(I) efflux system membrane fusion protein
MKFIKISIIFLLLCTILTVAAIWFINDNSTYEKIYDDSIAKLTGQTFDQTFNTIAEDNLKEHVKRHADLTYICPMHPQIVKNEPSNCPICGMDLVLKEPIAAEPSQQASKEKKILYWVAPMDANYRRDEAGKSPMGMDLVPVYEKGNNDTSADDFPKITINATTAQNMGVRIEKARRHALSRTIKTIGSVTYNEDTLHHVHVRSKGWVERVYARSLGDKVTKGKTLLEYYSPDIVAAQKDLLIARRAGSVIGGRGQSLTEASKSRLRDLDVPQSVINTISRTAKTQHRIPIIAQHSGVVTRVGIRNGMYITPTTELYTIADLSTVWVIVDVFEHQLTWVKQGNKAIIEVQAIAGKTWQGTVDYIYPELNPNTRTLRVRLKFDTPKQRLKPNMFADVTLYNQSRQALTVPSEAIIYYENSPRVVKVVSENKYQPVAVKIGMKSNGQVEILSGLNDGDDILVSGQFMIDSESNLQASFRRLSGQ